VVIGELRRILAGTAAFDFQLTRTAWFGDEILWLAPERSPDLPILLLPPRHDPTDAIERQLDGKCASRGELDDRLVIKQ
jgi:hypothetical protein